MVAEVYSPAVTGAAMRARLEAVRSGSREAPEADA
jgi:hypothetical protein